MMDKIYLADAVRWARYGGFPDPFEGKFILINHIEKYLLNHGWFVHRKTEDIAIYYYGNPTLLVIRIANNYDFDDYGSCILRAIKTCSELEKRPMFDIWSEMKRPQYYEKSNPSNLSDLNPNLTKRESNLFF